MVLVEKLKDVENIHEAKTDEWKRNYGVKLKGYSSALCLDLLNTAKSKQLRI